MRLSTLRTVIFRDVCNMLAVVLKRARPCFDVRTLLVWLATRADKFVKCFTELGRNDETRLLFERAETHPEQLIRDGFTLTSIVLNL